MNKIIYTTIAAVLIVFVLLVVGKKQQEVITDEGSEANVALAAEYLSVVEKEHDFGTISMAAGPVSHDYIVKNTGSTTVALTDLYTSCMCTEAAIKFADGKSVGPFGMQGHGYSPALRGEIAPGEEVIIKATFDPAAHGPAGVGAIDRVVVLGNKAGTLVELGLSAVVTP